MCIRDSEKNVVRVVPSGSAVGTAAADLAVDWTSRTHLSDVQQPRYKPAQKRQLSEQEGARAHIGIDHNNSGRARAKEGAGST